MRHERDAGARRALSAYRRRLSGEQLGRALDGVSGSALVHGVITELELEPGQVEAVAAFDVLNHVPRELLPGRTGEWLVQPMSVVGFAPEETRRLLADAGFELDRDELMAIRVRERELTSHWVLATTR